VRFSIPGSGAYGPRALDIRGRTAVAQVLIVTQTPIESIVRQDNVASAMMWRRTARNLLRSEDIAGAAQPRMKRAACVGIVRRDTHWRAALSTTTSKVAVAGSTIEKSSAAYAAVQIASVSSDAGRGMRTSVWQRG
jgi:hypothetical protein